MARHLTIAGRPGDLLFEALYAALGLPQECHLWVLLARAQMLLSIPALMFARSSQLKTCVPQISTIPTNALPMHMHLIDIYALHAEGSLCSTHTS